LAQPVYLRIADDLRRRIVEGRLTRSWYRESRGGSPFRADMESQGRTGSWRASSETATAPPAIAERLGVPEGAEVMRTRYTFLADGEPAMLSTSWEPVDITRGTPIMLPEEGPHAGAGVVARMRASDPGRGGRASGRAHRDDRDGHPAHVLWGAASGERPVETADIIAPVDRYEVAYTIPVD